MKANTNNGYDNFADAITNYAKDLIEKCKGTPEQKLLKQQHKNGEISLADLIERI